MARFRFLLTLAGVTGGLIAGDMLAGDLVPFDLGFEATCLKAGAGVAGGLDNCCGDTALGGEDNIAAAFAADARVCRVVMMSFEWLGEDKKLCRRCNEMIRYCPHPV